MLHQHSILNPVSCYGIGVHSGDKVQMNLIPAPPNTGIVFIRTDISNISNSIDASYNNVCNVDYATSVQNDAGVQITTIEHLMAALWGCGIDNVFIELDRPEVPIMDGSSKSFVFMLECAGKKLQDAKKRIIKITREVSVQDKNKRIVISPAEQLEIDLTIEFSNKVIGKQNFYFSSTNVFSKDLAEARTFGFVEDIEYLRKNGLALGASLDNAIAIDKDKILNHTGLRYKDEFVRHKVLDMLGDFYSGGNIIGKVDGFCTGHAINNQLLRKVFSDPNNYSYIE